MGHDSSEHGTLAIDPNEVAALKKEMTRPSRRNVKVLVVLALGEVFMKALDRGQLLSPHEMVRAASRRMRARLRVRGQLNNDTDVRDPRHLALQLHAIEDAYCIAARIYTDYVRELIPSTKTATKGRPRSIDGGQDILMQLDLTHLKKAQLLGLKIATPDDKRKAKNVVRKRISLSKRRIKE